MGSGKTETLIESRNVSSTGDVMVGSIRLQKDEGKNQVHAHDGTMYFRFDGISKFLDLWDIFWLNSPALGTPDNRYHRVIFRGLTDKPGGGRTACDLIFELGEDGRWNAYLDKAGTIEGYVMNDPNIMKANYYLKYGEK